MICAGCSDDFFSVNTSTEVELEEFFTTSEHAVLAANACYAPLQENGFYGRDYVYLTLWPSDDIIATDESEYDDFLYTASSEKIENVWYSCYRGVKNCNFCIENVSAMTNIDSDLQERIIGEAKFLRALYYFHIVNLWGYDFPLVLETFDSFEDFTSISLASEEQAWSQIEEDLKNAIDVLPTKYTDGDDAGRATQRAAQALLGKVYLYQEEYSLSAQQLKEIIDDTDYSLWTDTIYCQSSGLAYSSAYESVFVPENENNCEILFAVQFDDGLEDNPYVDDDVETGNLRHTYFGPEQAGGLQQGYISTSLVSYHESGDIRLKASVLVPGNTLDIHTFGSDSIIDEDQSPSGYCLKKCLYPFENIGEGTSRINIPVFRYADVLLMYAECIANGGATGEIDTYIDPIRKRAGLGTLDKYRELFPYYTDMELIEQERHIELACEHQRFFDLRRWDEAELMLEDSGFKERHNYYPIPQSEIDNSNGWLTQKTVWE